MSKACAAGRVEWRPSRNNDRTKTVWEVLPFYTRTCDARAIFVRGGKPAELAQIPRMSVRQWEHYQSVTNRSNPVLQGLQWLQLFENKSVHTYAQAAQIAGVCRGRVWQLVSLVTRLPREITDFLVSNKDPFIRAHFSERRLRPLTLLESDEKKVEQFRKMLTEDADVSFRRTGGRCAGRRELPEHGKRPARRWLSELPCS